MSNQINLQSCDNHVIPVDIELAKISSTLREMIGFNLGNHSEEPIKLQQINASTLKKVLEWVHHHKDDVPKEGDAEEGMSDEISEWDENFLNVHDSTLYEMIFAANYLHIKGLMQLTCKAVANMITGKTPEQVRDIFKIQCDFTKEEENRLKKENEWCHTN